MAEAAEAVEAAGRCEAHISLNTLSLTGATDWTDCTWRALRMSRQQRRRASGGTLT